MKFIVKAIAALGLCLAAHFTPTYADTAANVQAPKITTGTAVRVRANPAVSAAEVGKLPFGTILVTQQRSPNQDRVGSKKDYWYSVNTPVKGWVFGGLLQDYDANNPDKIAVQLIRSKLGKADRLMNSSVLNYNDSFEISQFAQQAASKAKSVELAGDLKLAHLQAVQQGLYAIPINQAKNQPYAGWIKSLGNQIFYHELAGGYYVDSRYLWNLADQYKQAQIGDTIAWQAAHASLGGECEGFVECMSYRMQITQGEYLKRYPKGQYVTPMLKEINEDLTYMLKEAPQQKDNVKEIDFATWDKLLSPLSQSATLAQTKDLLNKLKKYK